MSQTIALIIPCYDEAQRLDWPAFDAALPDLYQLFVDDGSSDGTAAEIGRHLRKGRELLPLPRNGGKAEAVRAGMLHLQRQPFFRQLAWVGFWDADLATPLTEVPGFLDWAERLQPPPEALFGSRVLRLGGKIERRWWRHYLGRLFATAAKLSLGVESYDSQCGAKLFRPALLEKAFSRPFSSPWFFDLELLLRLRGCALEEYPLRRWRDVPGSKVRLGRMLFLVPLELWRLRRAYLRD